MLLLVATPTLAHRLDEYLQATTFIVDGDHVEVQMRLSSLGFLGADGEQ